QEARDVQENVGRARKTCQLLGRRADSALGGEEGCATFQPERPHEAPEIEVRLRLQALCRLDEVDVVPEPRKADHVLEHRPRGAALVRIAGDHPGDQDLPPFHATPARTSRSSRTLSESRYVSADDRAADAWTP